MGSYQMVLTAEVQEGRGRPSCKNLLVLACIGRPGTREAGCGRPAEEIELMRRVRRNDLIINCLGQKHPAGMVLGRSALGSRWGVSVLSLANTDFGKWGFHCGITGFGVWHNRFHCGITTFRVWHNRVQLWHNRFALWQVHFICGKTGLSVAKPG